MTHRDYFFEAFDKWLIDDNIDVVGTKLLDVGCGSDLMKKDFETRGFVWMGTDSMPKTNNVLRSSMEDMKEVPDDMYDFVIACHSFEHCERPIDALREFRRVLKSGGWLFIATPYPCRHQILDADADHIFVLGNMHMARLLVYTLFDKAKSSIWDAPLEQDKTVCSIGQRP